VEGLDLTDLTPVGLFAFVLACIRIALGQADKRASTAEAREGVCTTALATCIASSAAQTDEIRNTNVAAMARIDAVDRRMESGLSRLEAIQRSLTELLGQGRP
jgi:hypothetical protein